MIIKTNEFELEITQGADIYLGSRKTGQIFKQWDEVTENVRVELKSIVEQAEKLAKYSEELLLTTSNNRTKKSDIFRHNVSPI